jgi:hypothetical protein
LLDAGEQVIANIAVAVGDRVCVFERDAFAAVEERAVFPLLQGGKLVIGDVLLAADGSVQVRSELAAVDQRNPAIQHRLQLAVDQL